MADDFMGNGTDDKRIYHYRFRLNEEENRRFLEMLEQSGAPTKTRFIVGRLFAKEFRVVKTDGTKHQYYALLCDFYRQFRGLANNYNQVTTAIHRTFDERKARYLLSELKAQTGKLGEILGKVFQNIEEVKQLWLSESGEENRSTER